MCEHIAIAAFNLMKRNGGASRDRTDGVIVANDALLPPDLQPQLFDLLDRLIEHHGTLVLVVLIFAITI